MDNKKVKEVVIHIASMMAEKDNITQNITDAINTQSEQIDIDKKVLRKLATLYNKQSLHDYKNEHDEVLSIYESIMNN